MLNDCIFFRMFKFSTSVKTGFGIMISMEVIST